MAMITVFCFLAVLGLSGEVLGATTQRRVPTSRSDNENLISWPTCPPPGTVGENELTVNLQPDTTKKYALFSPGYVTDNIGYPDAGGDIHSFYECSITINFVGMTVKPNITLTEEDFTLQGGKSCSSDYVLIQNLEDCPVEDPDDVIPGEIDSVKYCASLTNDKCLKIRGNSIRISFKVNAKVRQRGFKMLFNYPNQ